MERIKGILNNKKYRESLKKNVEAEADRIYCGHDLSHFLDVARIAYILVLEEDLPISKEVVYATALLHDIGRHIQYKDGTPHEIASASIAKNILEKEMFLEEEIVVIIGAILHHGSKNFDDPYYAVFFRADKCSRLCHTCDAISSCKWDDDQINHQIEY